jgi:predicted outer membrane repeat protein
MLSLSSRVFTLCLTLLLATAGLVTMLSGLGWVERASAMPAAIFIVSNVNDSGPDSLRQAILHANAAPGEDLIQITAVGVITLLSPLPPISEAVTIEGPGANLLAIDGNNQWRLLDVAAVTVTVSSLTLQNGQPASDAGGGLRSLGVLSLRQVHVLSNTSPTGGGGVYAAGTLLVEGGLFANNYSAGGVGGGLWATGPAVISGTTFANNRANGQGGGAHLSGGSQVSHGRFEHNRSLTSNGGGMYATAGTTLTNMQFHNNVAQTDGGGVLAFGQAAVYGSHFSNNQSNNRGGALYVGSFLTITHSAFTGNSGGRGGAVYHGVFSGYVENSLFAGNTATLAGEHLFLNGSATVALRHVTAVGLGSGTAVHVAHSSVSISNTLIASHTLGVNNLSGSVVQDYNLFFGNGTDTQGVVTGGAHNTSGDPRFIAPWQNNYHLGAGSAAIDAGVDAGIVTDFDGESRPLAAGFDIGFDEANYMDGLAITFAPSPTTSVGLATIFTATVTHGTGISYRWAFGDGTVITGGNPVSHTFAAPGLFTVAVTATNSSGSIGATTAVPVTLPIETPITQIYLPMLIGDAP